MSFVVFRAETLAATAGVFQSLFGLGGNAVPTGGALAPLVGGAAAAIFAIQAVDYFATRRGVAALLVLPRRFPALGLIIVVLFVLAFAAKRQMVGSAGGGFERFIYFDF